MLPLAWMPFAKVRLDTKPITMYQVRERATLVTKWNGLSQEDLGHGNNWNWTQKGRPP